MLMRGTTCTRFRKRFYDRVMSRLTWSDAQRKFILELIAELARRVDNDAVRAIWTPALEL